MQAVSASPASFPVTLQSVIHPSPAPCCHALLCRHAPFGRSLDESDSDSAYASSLSSAAEDCWTATDGTLRRGCFSQRVPGPQSLGRGQSFDLFEEDAAGGAGASSGLTALDRRRRFSHASSLSTGSAGTLDAFPVVAASSRASSSPSLLAASTATPSSKSLRGARSQTLPELDEDVLEVLVPEDQERKGKGS